MSNSDKELSLSEVIAIVVVMVTVIGSLLYSSYMTHQECMKALETNNQVVQQMVCR